MQVSARDGLTLGLKKRARSLVTPADLKAILLLWDLKNPVDVEHVFAITVMMNTGTRGGEELRNMNWGQFERQYSEQVGFYYTFSPMEQGTFKNNKGGLKDFKKVRKKVQIFDNKNVMDCFNPYKVILGYESLLPKGWSDSIKARPLFLKPLRIINNGVGFQPIPKGHNVTGKFLERAMNRIGKVGTFCNTQTRASFINGAMETGMRDNEIKAVTGQRSGVTLNSYKDPSLAFKKASSERMLGSLGVGGSTWHAGLAKNNQLALCNTQANNHNGGHSLVLQPKNTNLMPSHHSSTKKKLIFGKRWKIYQREVSKRDLFELSSRNQDLLKTIMQQQTELFKPTDNKTVEDINTIANESTVFISKVVEKRMMFHPVAPLRKLKRKKRFKSAAELGLNLN